MSLSDAATVAVLEQQFRELHMLLERLEVARCHLMPPMGAVWRGTARQAFDTALAAMRSTLDASVDAIRLARDSTHMALREWGRDV